MNEEAPPPPKGKPDGPITNSAQLKAEINSGQTGDKVAHFDAAASPLGTDDEAGPAEVTPERVAMSRAGEARAGAAAGGTDASRTRNTTDGGNKWVVPAAIAAAILLGALLYLALT